VSSKYISQEGFHLSTSGTHFVPDVDKLTKHQQEQLTKLRTYDLTAKTPEQHRSWAEAADFRYRIAYASNKTATPEWLAKLVKDSSLSVRKAAKRTLADRAYANEADLNELFRGWTLPEKADHER